MGLDGLYSLSALDKGWPYLLGGERHVSIHFSWKQNPVDLGEEDDDLLDPHVQERCSVCCIQELVVVVVVALERRSGGTRHSVG